MSSTLYGKFFWSDWLSDPGIRASSYAARGLWMDMLCIAATADPAGYLVLNGRPLETADIARLTGGIPSEVGPLLEELERNGVFSRDRQQRIYSRRLIRDAKKAEIAVANGKMGGNPSLRKTKGNSGSDNPTVGGDDKPPDKTRLKAYSPEANSQKQAILSESDAARDPPDPLRAGWLRAEVSKAFDAVGSTTLPDTSRCEVWLRQGRDPELCAAVVREQLARRPDIRSLAYFDGPIRDAHAGREAVAAASVPAAGANIEERWRAAINAWKSGWWMVQWEDFCGGPPDSPRCTIPAALLEECGANVAASAH